MKLFSKVALVLLCLLSVACKKETDPSVLLYTTIVNDSHHMVSVSMVENTLKGDTLSFVLLPGEKYDIKNRTTLVKVLEATVTFDNNITVIHELTGDSTPEGFRNICYTKWWETRQEDVKGEVRLLHIFTFTDDDYEYAAQSK